RCDARRARLGGHALGWPERCPTVRVVSTTIWPERIWQARRAAHERRVDPWLAPHLQRARVGERHPVEDFLFTYYSFRPARLRRWEPGWGGVLAGDAAREFLERRGYIETADGVTLGPELLHKRLSSIRWIRDLLVATQHRPAFFGCFGLHEWAMVYRLAPSDIRHADHPLRLGSADT